MKKTTRRRGFTLIELVMVIVLIGIIAVFIAPRMVAVTSTKAGAFRDKLKADIRYSQNLAMTMNARYRVYLNTAPAPAPYGYAVTDGAGTVVQDPAGGGLLSVVLNAGDYADITFAVAPLYPFIEFDSLGRPYDNAGTLLAGAVVLTLSSGGGTVTISPQTGAVN